MDEERVRGGAISKSDVQRKHNVVVLSLGHWVTDQNSNVTGYREDKSEHT